MPKYYICIDVSDSPHRLTLGKKYISYQPEDGGNPDATWHNVVDDTGFIHSHDKELFKTMDEVRNDTIKNILNEN